MWFSIDISINYSICETLFYIILQNYLFLQNYFKLYKIVINICSNISKKNV